MFKQNKTTDCFNYFNELSPGYFEGYDPFRKEYTSSDITFINRLHESNDKAIHSHTFDPNIQVSLTRKIISKLSASLLSRNISAASGRIPVMLRQLGQSLSAASLYESHTPQTKHQMSDVMRRTSVYMIRIIVTVSRIPNIPECISFIMSRTHAILTRLPECFYNVPVTTGHDPLNSRNSSTGKLRLPSPFNFIIYCVRRFPVLNGNNSL